jgi:rhodanese-related sulfurtransferase
MGAVHDVTIDEVKAGLAAHSILLIDVREPHEFVAGHIPGAINLPLSSFDPAEIQARPGQQVVFSCRSGSRTLKAIAAAQAAGFPYDTHFPGSMLEWLAMGEPVETS